MHKLNIFDRFLDLIKTLNEKEVDYILIGGYAVVLHGFTRATQDIDLFINPTEENVRKLKSALIKHFNDASIDEITLSELQKYPVIRYGTDQGFYIDIIVKIGDVFNYSDLEYEIKEIENVGIRTATASTLLKLKSNTNREIDQLDIKFLELKIKRDANK